MKIYFKINGKQYTIPQEFGNRIVSLSIKYSTPSTMWSILLLKVLDLLHYDKHFKLDLIVPYPNIVFVIENAITDAETALLVFHTSRLLNSGKFGSFKFKGYTLSEWEDDIKTSRLIFLDFREYLLKRYFPSYINFTYNMFDDLNKYKGVYTVSINSSSLGEDNIPCFIKAFDNLVANENTDKIMEYFNSVGEFDEKKFLPLEEANVLNSLSILDISTKNFFLKENELLYKCNKAIECFACDGNLSKFEIDCVRAFINGYGFIASCSKKKQSDLRKSLSAVCKSNTLIELTEAYMPYIELANIINNLNK